MLTTPTLGRVGSLVEGPRMNTRDATAVRAAEHGRLQLSHSVLSSAGRSTRGRLFFPELKSTCPLTRWSNGIHLLSGTCQGHVGDMLSGTCQGGHVSDVSGTCQGHVSDSSGDESRHTADAVWRDGGVALRTAARTPTRARTWCGTGGRRTWMCGSHARPHSRSSCLRCGHARQSPARSSPETRPAARYAGGG